MTGKAFEAQVWREVTGGYSAVVWLPGKATVDVFAPTWRAFRAAMRQINCDLGRVRERDLKDGMGFLERALRDSA